MKPYLVDVPVKINIWIRPECQLKQFEVIKEARPSILFLISDGGRNDAEWEAIKKNRNLYDNEIDWDCKVYKIYEEKNNGLYAMSKKAIELIWSTVDRCIFLEDDHVPSVSFFKFCEELLEKYKDDPRVCRICGMNHIEVSKDVSSDYFFATNGGIWGIATWKRVFELRKDAFAYVNDEYAFNLLKKKCKKDKFFLDKLIGYAKDPMYDGHVAWGEFYYRFYSYAYDMLNIIPKYNMIANLGGTENSAHSTEYKLMPKSNKKLFNMKTYEYDFPLKHPQYIMEDDDYVNEMEKILTMNRPFRAFLRKFEIFFLYIRYKGLSSAFKKIIRRITRKKRIET